MFLRRPHWWLPVSFPGWLLAMLALTSQLALGAVVLPDEAGGRNHSVATLDALSILCNSAAPTAPHQVPHHRHHPDCVLCPLCVALAMPAVILTSGPELPQPTFRLTEGAALLPPARGPPAQPRHTPPSRGPPSLS
jgi:hypothetical protein